MEKIIYYSKTDALNAANNFLSNNPGARILRTNAVIDHYSRNVEEDERFIQKVGLWSGEMSAIEICDSKHNTIALFGF